jgi:predicted Fe-Mo cluster-binding NifX family protein
MKIAITAKNSDLDSDVDLRFGRCNYFLIVDIDTLNFETISNESAMTSGGAGIQAAQTIAKSGIKVIITGNVGPNAFQTLTAAGIKVYIGADGTIKQTIEKYKRGVFKETDSPNVKSHSGMRR